MKMTDRIPVLNLINLAIAIVLISNTLSAQDFRSDSIKSGLHSNSLFLNFGAVKSMVNTTIYYERMFQRNALKTKIVTLVKVGYGEVASWEGATSNYILGQYGILTGLKKHHMEVNAGLVIFLKDVDLFPIAGSIGYRIQKPGGLFLFRAGLGWPEALYFGWGVSF